MTTLVIFLVLAQQLTGKPLIAGVGEGAGRDSEQRNRAVPLTAEQQADINKQIEILTHQVRSLGSQVTIIHLLNSYQISYMFLLSSIYV